MEGQTGGVPCSLWLVLLSPACGGQRWDSKQVLGLPGSDTGAFSAASGCLLSQSAAMLRLILTAWVTAHQLGCTRPRTDLSLQKSQAGQQWGGQMDRAADAQLTRSLHLQGLVSPRPSDLLPAVTSNP